VTDPRPAPGPAPQLAPRGPSPRRGGPPDRAPGRERRRLPVLLVVAACIVIAAAWGLSGTDASTTARAGNTIAAAVPTVAEPDTVSSTWYCAEGTGSPGGRADETIIVANEGNTEARAVVTVMAGGRGEPESRRVAVPPGGQVRVPVSSVLQTPEHPDDAGLVVGPGVVVEVFGGGSIVEHEIVGESDLAVGPCARQAGRDWYFAAGTTERGAEDNAALFNPFPDDAIVDLTFATDAGFIAPADLQALVVPRRSRLTVPVGNFVRRQAQVALHVHVRTGRIVAEQSLTFTAENETRRGLTLSLGAPSPESSWSLPGVVPADGTSHAVLVANFDTSATEVEIAPRFEEPSSTRPKPVPVGGRSVAVVDLESLGGSGAPLAFDVRTTRASPVVVEELASWAPPAAAAGSATTLASPVQAPGWAFAAGRLTPDGDAGVSVLNPGPKSTTVRLLAYESGGGDEPTSVGELQVPARAQARFDLVELGVAPDQVVVVRADAPVIAAGRIVGPTGVSLALGVAEPDAGYGPLRS
jgi:Family of unknown function (DUF5719)